MWHYMAKSLPKMIIFVRLYHDLSDLTSWVDDIQETTSHLAPGHGSHIEQ